MLLSEDNIFHQLRCFPIRFACQWLLLSPGLVLWFLGYGNELGVGGIVVHVLEVKPKQPCRQDIIRVDFRSMITLFGRQDDDTRCPHSLHALLITLNVP